MVDLKNEVAGIVAILGFVSLVLTVTGLASILDVILGSGSDVLVLVTDGGSLAGAAAARGGEGGVFGAAILTGLGVAGLLSAWSAVESGYFDPDEERETAPETTSDEAGAVVESEGESEPA